MSRKLYNIIENENKQIMLLYGEIGDYEELRCGDIVKDLMNATGKVDVRINSNGGEVYCGIAIFNALRNSNADINIYIDGIAASMASVIALCGKHVEMSKYARLMLHSVSGGCYGNKKELQKCIDEITKLEETLCDMYSSKTGMTKTDIQSKFFDGEDHWLTAEEALSLGFIDGIYDADPIPSNSTPEQIYSIFNNRLTLREPQNNKTMNIEELRKRPHFQDCVTEDDVLKRIDHLEANSSKLTELLEKTSKLEKQLKVFEDRAKEEADNAIKTILDQAQSDGRIDAKSRPMYENILKSNPEDGKKVIESLQPKKRILTDLRVNISNDSPWEARMKEIKNKYKR